MLQYATCVEFCYIIGCAMAGSRPGIQVEWGTYRGPDWSINGLDGRDGLRIIRHDSPIAGFPVESL